MSKEMIRDTVERVFQNEISRDLIEKVESGTFADELWETAVQTGLTKVVCREDYGGIGADWVDASQIFYAIGHSQAPIPLASTIIGQFFASLNGLDIAAEQVFAVITSSQSTDLQVIGSGPGGRPVLRGNCKAVKWARWANWLIIEFDGNLWLLDSKKNGVAITEGRDPCAMPSDAVFLDDVEVDHVLMCELPECVDPLETVQAAVLGMMLTGALSFALELSVQYAKDRIQFGRPIGKNQAIQQQLALMATEVSSSHAACETAMRDLPIHSGTAAPRANFSAAVAKIISSDAVSNGASIAHQVHGAIGFTYEYPLNFATRRLWAWRSEGGSSSYWAQILGQAYVQGGRDAFWENLTARTLPR